MVKELWIHFEKLRSKLWVDLYKTLLVGFKQYSHSSRGKASSSFLIEVMLLCSLETATWLSCNIFCTNWIYNYNAINYLMKEEYFELWDMIAVFLLFIACLYYYKLTLTLSLTFKSIPLKRSLLIQRKYKTATCKG